jgi:hypothetical protein
MCYYENERYACGDYTWKNFKQHCNREYRMGETCGMKLVYETIEIPRKCPTCEEVDRKLRKRDKHVANIQRWTMEGTNPASRHRALEEIAEIDEALQRLYQKLAHARTNIGNPTRSRRLG